MLAGDEDDAESLNGGMYDREQSYVEHMSPSGEIEMNSIEAVVEEEESADKEAETATADLFTKSSDALQEATDIPPSQVKSPHQISNWPYAESSALQMISESYSPLVASRQPPGEAFMTDVSIGNSLVATVDRSPSLAADLTANVSDLGRGKFDTDIELPTELSTSGIIFPPSPDPEWKTRAFNESFMNLSKTTSLNESPSASATLATDVLHGFLGADELLAPMDFTPLSVGPISSAILTDESGIFGDDRNTRPSEKEVTTVSVSMAEIEYGEHVEEPISTS